MVKRYLDVQTAVVAAPRSKELSHIKEKACLKPLKDITAMLCSESIPTVSIIMPLHYKLISSILSHSENDSSAISEMKTVMRNDLSGRYSDKKIILI